MSNRTLKLLILSGVGFIALLTAGTSLYFHLGAPPATEAKMEAAAAESPLPQEVLDLVAEGKLGDALDIVRPLIDADHKNVELITAGAQLNLEAKRYAEAARLSHKVLELEPDHAFSHAIIGVTLFQGSQFEDSLKSSLKAIQVDPKLWLSYLTIGDIYLREGKIEDAVTVLKQAARLAPNSAEAWTRLSSAYIKKQDYPKALLACEAALQADPHFAGAHFNMAHVYFRKGDAHNALKHIQKAEDMYRQQQNINWLAKSRHNKEMYIKHFKLRPEDLGGTAKSG